MAGLTDLVGVLIQGGLTQSGSSRVEKALGQDGLAQPGGMLEQMMGGTGVGSDMLGGLMDAARNVLSGQKQSSLGNNPLATGGIGALAGALLGGGSGSVKGAVGGGAMALLAGLAFQAFKNYTQQPGGAGMPFTPNSPPPRVLAPANAEEEQQLEAQASVVVRGMINAAKADGQVDSEELGKIVDRLKQADADEATLHWVMDELRGPYDLEQLVSDIPDQTVAAQVYLASLFAIEVDSQAEIDYLQKLAQRTGLDRAMVQQLHRMVGMED